MSKELVTEYAAAKLKIKQLEEQCDMMQPDVLKYIAQRMADSDNQPVVLPEMGTFSVYPRRVWKYTPECDDLKKKYEDRKKVEQAKGWAEAEEVPTLKFNPLEN